MMASYPGQLLSKTFACHSMCLKPTLFDSTAFQRCLGHPKWFFSFAVPRQRQRAASSSDAQTRRAKLGLTWLAGRQRSAGRPSRQPLEEALRKDDWAANAAVKCPTGARTVVSRARAGGNCREFLPPRMEPRPPPRGAAAERHPRRGWLRGAPPRPRRSCAQHDVLEKRPALGCDGDTPSPSEVVGACRHLPLDSVSRVKCC